MALKHAGITLADVLTAEAQALPVDIKEWVRRSLLDCLLMSSTALWTIIQSWKFTINWSHFIRIQYKISHGPVGICCRVNSSIKKHVYSWIFKYFKYVVFIHVNKPAGLKLHREPLTVSQRFPSGWRCFLIDLWWARASSSSGPDQNHSSCQPEAPSEATAEMSCDRFTSSLVPPTELQLAAPRLNQRYKHDQFSQSR